ncbi:MAG: hypothetical protein JNM40_17770 [Myxococcales bacterium]|nr:hypothetical protein [Myxococcales bacterium]
MSSKRFLKATLGFLSVSLGLLSSCGDSGDYAILVRISNRPADTVSLYATAKLGDAAAMKGMDITSGLDSIGIRLPADKSGILTVDIAALGSDQCKSASGTAIIDLSKGRGQEVSVSLSTLTPRRCSLLLTQSGEGSVSLSSTGALCGTGCYDFNQGDTITLKFNPTGKSYGAQTYVSSSSVCDGVNDCTIKMDRRIQVDAKFQPRLCLSQWCWYHPLPQGQSLYGIWGTSASDIWAVGDAGTAMHYDGQSWSLQNSGTKNALNGVWSAIPNSAWVVGDTGTALHWDGSKFVSETSGTANHLNSVWGSSDGKLVAVGAQGTILQRNGTAWSPQSSGVTTNLYRVNGSDEQNIWVVGQTNTVLKGNGSSWMKQPSPGLGPLADVWTSGPSDVWAVGGTSSLDCGVARWDGAAWATSNACKLGLRALWGYAGREVWVAGAEKLVTRFPGADLSKPSTRDILGDGITNVPTYNAAWGPSAGEVYLATDGGTIIRTVSDTRGTQLLAPFPSLSPNTALGVVKSITGFGGVNYILFDDGTVFSYDGKKFTLLPNPPPGTGFFDAWATQGKVVLGTDTGYVLEFASNTWAALKLGNASSNVGAVGGFSALDYYASSDAGFLYRVQNGISPLAALNGTAFSGSVRSIWSRSATETWAVGLSGTVVRVSGSTTTTVPGVTSLAGSTSLYSVHGAALPNKYVWMVGASGLVIRYDTSKGQYNTIPSPVTTKLNSVVALSDTDVWISGDNGVLLHSTDGNTLTVVPGPFGTRSLVEMYSPAANDIWLAGSGNSIWRYQP